MLKARADKPGTIQRVSAALASRVDLEEAYATGEQAVRHAVEGKSGFMVTLEREPGSEYACKTGIVSLEEVANREKKMPREFINAEGNGSEAGVFGLRDPADRGPASRIRAAGKTFRQKVALIKGERGDISRFFPPLLVHFVSGLWYPITHK